MADQLNPEVLVQPDWQPAPSRTEWGPGMLRVGISITEDETLELVLSEEGLAMPRMERSASRLANPSGPWPSAPKRGAATAVELSSSAPATQGPGSSMITPLRRLVERQPYQPGADELLILPEHFLEDVLRRLVQECGGDREELVAILATMPLQQQQVKP